MNLTPSVLAQTCLVKSPDGDAMQGAVIVRNNQSSLYQANVSVSLFRPSGHQVLEDWDRPKSGVGAKSWSVCFGKTITYPGSTRAEGP
ncbi:hypothetical protein [Amycolatopsis albispora]|uniref:Uncharacterized protein n=1 Tax=Amycolatopsis albispora TaxID=1804986 RepID=A0A344L8A6_9PSEU|nr:hypothetical protein [Amycolatopsis albispora]AXB44280.1 hypothetical protein A4R43_18595 [Amycolatopsis albispora]